MSFGAGRSDFWLVKTNATGHVEWNQTYGGTNGNVGRSMVQTDDGGYIIAGYSSSGAVDVDVWLVKADANGTLQWSRTYSGTTDDYGWSVMQTDDGGYIIAGETWSFGEGDSDFWVIKTDEFGNVE